MNWKHSCYELYALSIGQAFTMDEAHRILSELKEDRQIAIASALAENKRAQAKVIDSRVVLEDYKSGAESKSNLRRSEAFLLENMARHQIAQPCFDMAHVELAFINKMLTLIEPHCIYEDHAVGYQMVQATEMAFEYVLMAAFNAMSVDSWRNLNANPHKETILRFIDDLPKSKDVHKLSLAFADALNISNKYIAQYHLSAIHDEVFSIEFITPTLGKYIESTELSASQLKRLGGPDGLSDIIS